MRGDEVLIDSSLDGLSVATYHSPMIVHNDVVDALGGPLAIRIPLIDPHTIAPIIGIPPARTNLALLPERVPGAPILWNLAKVLVGQPSGGRTGRASSGIRRFREEL